MDSVGIRDLVVLLLLFLAIFFGLSILIFMAVVIRRRQAAPQPGGPARCSFCLKPQAQVQKLIAGPSVYICNECVTICNEIISSNRRTESLVDFPR